MIVLSMIGINDYKPTRYTWAGREAKPHHLVQQALAEWFAGANILVCVTSEAKNKYEQEIRSIPNARPVDILSGKNEAEYWEIFNKIEQEIPEGSELVLDITHGFRSLPILTLLAVSFLRAAKQVRVKHILYGAYDASQDGCTPVFDLTPFLSMLDWASATNRFLETGDARRFKDLLMTSPQKQLKAIGSSLDSFTNALILNRTQEVNQFARDFLKGLEQAESLQRPPEFEPLRLLEDRIVRDIRPLAQENEIFAQFAQIEWYAKHQQFAQAIALAREWMISVRIWKTDGRFSVFTEERTLAENWLNTFAKVLQHKSKAEKKAEEQGDKAALEKARAKRLEAIPPQWLDFLKLWQKISDQRNDYAHFAMRKQTITVDSSLQRAKTLVNDLRNAIGPLGLELPQEPS